MIRPHPRSSFQAIPGGVIEIARDLGGDNLKRGA